MLMHRSSIRSHWRWGMRLPSTTCALPFAEWPALPIGSHRVRVRDIGQLHRNTATPLSAVSKLSLKWRHKLLAEGRSLMTLFPSTSDHRSPLFSRCGAISALVSADYGRVNYMSCVRGNCLRWGSIGSGDFQSLGRMPWVNRALVWLRSSPITSLRE